MNKNNWYRLNSWFFTMIITGIGLSAVIYGLREHANLFVTPGYVVQHDDKLNHHSIRLGAVVKEHTVVVKAGKLWFVAAEPGSDAEIKVVFTGMPPSLFKERATMIAEGRYDDGILYADRILAKHDENYQPQAQKE